MAREFDSCPACELTYDAFRTGETFASMRRAMFVETSDTNAWRYKRRHGVLGFWHQWKVTMFRSHVEECEYYARLEAAEKAAARKPRGRSSARANL